MEPEGDPDLGGSHLGPSMRLISDFPLASIRSDDHPTAAQIVMERPLRREGLDAGRRWTSMP